MSQTENQADTPTIVNPAPPAAALHGDDGHTPPEVRAALSLARRYRLPYVDLLPPVGESPIDYALLGEIPVDLMLRHLFVPLRREGRRLHIAMADPTDLERLDEIASAVHARVVPHVATAGAIEVVLRKGDATQRVLQEAASGFRISLVKETEQVEPIDLAYHQTLISRIKVMSELDIAERRVPQDGRFRVRYKGRNVDFRVPIMPTVH